MKRIAKIQCIIVSLSIVVLCLSGCYEREVKDLHYEGMNVYYDYYDIVPQNCVPSNMLFTGNSETKNDLLQDYSYTSVEYHYFMKNYDNLSAGDYSLNIMILNYDSETYVRAKNYLFSNMNYTTKIPQYVYNSYEFYEHYIKNWSHEMEFVYHSFCDTKNIIILMNFSNAYKFSFQPKETLKSYIERDDFIGFFKKYYGDFYDFDQ